MSAAIWLQPALRSGGSTESLATNTASMAQDFVVSQSFWHEEQGGRCLQGSVLRCSQQALGDDRGFILPMSRDRFPCHGPASSGHSWSWGALLRLFFRISARHDCGELREWQWVRSASFNQVRPPAPALRALRHMEPVYLVINPARPKGESKCVESCLWRQWAWVLGERFCFKLSRLGTSEKQSLPHTSGWGRGGFVWGYLKHAVVLQWLWGAS